MRRKWMIVLFSFCLIVSASKATAQASGELKTNQEEAVKFKGGVDLESNEFKHETKAGLVFSTGNTRSLLINGSSQTLYRVRRWENKWKLGAFFSKIYDTTNPAVTPGTIGKYIFGTYRLDFYVTPRFSLYVGGGGYTDEIKGIDVALGGFAGASYYFVFTERQTLRGSVGYDYMHEDRVAPNPNDNIHSATGDLQYKLKVNERVDFIQEVALFDNLENGRDFRLNSDTEIKVSLIKHLALVLGEHIRFDNVPVAGFKKLDTITDFSVAVNF